LARLGLISRNFPADYKSNEQDYFSTESSPWLSLEYFSMLRTGKDVISEYRSYDELKRMR